MTTEDWVNLGYLAAAVCFVLALKGLSSPKYARRGSQVGSVGVLIAVVAVFFGLQSDDELGNLALIAIALLIGTGVGAVSARRVRMTAMPQMVAAFNGVGGAAAALVSLVEFEQAGQETGWGALAVVFAGLIGSVSASGSALTFLKLQELMTGRPVVFPGMQVAMGASALGAVVLAALVIATGGMTALVALLVVGLVVGVLLVLPVGGADVPIVISLLNAFTGLAVAASGAALGNVLLIIAGTLVGASGTMLTQMMASAMGRSVTGILFGAFSGPTSAGSTAVVGEGRPVRTASPEDVSIMLGYAKKVIFVPGYGLAVAQGQHTLQELAQVLESRGIEVSYAIHPVAGRMPGHMNVLLAEANVPYEALREMDEINPEFPRADVALVVGANDVVNPAAQTKGSPIYGMPILHVDEAQQVVFLKRSMRPGFAGIENELLFNPKTSLLFGDAKESLTKLLQSVKNL